MEKIIEFIGNNYTWFLTITLILLFALIGYIYDNRKVKEDAVDKIDNDKDDDLIVEEITTEVKEKEEQENISESIKIEENSVEDAIENNPDDIKVQ